VPLYAVDGLSRRAQALQNTKDAENSPTVQMSDQTAKRLKLLDGKIVTVKSSTGKTLLPLEINNKIPDNCVLIYQALPQTINLGPAYASIEVKP
jgi:NADH-quinone oxidoreductase subunit G